MSNSSDNPDSNKELKTRRWSFIQQELESAMHNWEELEKAEISLSPEEEQFAKIQNLIGQLKSKLDQF